MSESKAKNVKIGVIDNVVILIFVDHASAVDWSSKMQTQSLLARFKIKEPSTFHPRTIA